MMHANYTVRPGLVIHVEAETQAGLWDEMAAAMEVFGERCCALCKGTDLVPVSRHRDTKRGTLTFREWRCLNPVCGAVLNQGQTQQGGRLFPIRKLTPKGKASREQGEHGEHQGWTKYRGEPDEAQTPTPAAPPASSALPTSNGRTETTLAQSPGYRPTITSEQAAVLKRALEAAGVRQTAFLQRHAIAAWRDIRAADFDRILAVAQKPDAELLKINRKLAAADGARR